MISTIVNFFTSFLYPEGQVLSSSSNTSEVARYLKYVESCSMEKDGLIIDPNYKIELLDRSALVELYEELLKNQKNPVIEFLLFDIEDHIFHKIAENSEEGQEYLKYLKDQILAGKINAFLTKGSRFCKADQVRMPSSDASGHPISGHPIKVLKLGLENTRNNVAGVGAVLLGLRQAHAKLGLEKIDSLHPLYVKDKGAARGYEFQGLIQHLYKGNVVKSAVYRNRKDREYAIQPDPQYRDLFNTPPQDSVHVYASTPFTDHTERVLYCGSAAAAFSHLYRGKSGEKQIHIVHADSNTVAGCAFSLMDQRKQTAKRVYVMHGKLRESMPVTLGDLKGIGVDISQRKQGFIDLVDEGMKRAGKVVFVSSDLARAAQSQDPSISFGHDQSLQGPGKVAVIRNGVASEDFDVTNEKTFKQFALKRTFDQNGQETTDYVGYRNSLKEKLFKAGLIADPSLPLILYIGRYATEKGIDILVDVVRNTDPSQAQAQFVSMGILFGEDRLVQQMKKMEDSSHKEILRCYTKKEQQRTKFSYEGVEYPISVGQMIRAAADFCIMPSHEEPCGLVSMETQCAGSLLIAPFHQGFVDICKPHGYWYPDGSGVIYNLATNANSVCYRDHKDPRQAREAMKQALTFWQKMTKEEKNRMARRIHNEAIPEFSWYHKDDRTRIITGASVAYHRLYEELAVGNAEKEKSTPIPPVQTTYASTPSTETEFTLIPPIQNSALPVPAPSSIFSRTVKKIALWARQFFTFQAERVRRWYWQFRSLFNNWRRSKSVLLMPDSIK